MLRSIGTLSFCLSAVIAWSCSCFGPQTFCESTDSSWFEPDVIVLGVKLNEIHYGMRIKVVEVVSGNVAVGDTLMVWGDNGALCRWYVGAWSVGDTVVWGFHETDFMGNFITAGYPPNLEQAGDFHISICGTYWLNYASGMVSGPIAPGLGSVSLAALMNFTAGCINTGVLITEPGQGPRVFVDPGQGSLQVVLPKGSGPVEVVVTNMQGQLVWQWHASLGSGSLNRDIREWGGGIYFVTLYTQERAWTERVLVPGA